MLFQTYNFGRILILATLNMATFVAETFRWSLYNKLTFLNSSAIFCLSKNSIHLINAQTIAHMKLYH